MRQQTICRVRWHAAFDTIVYTDNEDEARATITVLWARTRIPADTQCRHLTQTMIIDNVRTP